MSYMRRPRTANEMRQFDPELAEYGVKIRGKRKPKNLPNSWDDIPVQRFRCWKVNRQTQYR